MVKHLLFFTALLALQGCTLLDALDVVNPFKEDKGIKTDIQVGKNNSKIDNKSLAQLTSNDSSTHTSTITADAVTQITENKDPIWLVVAFASVAGLMGFFIQSPVSRRRIKEQKETINELRSSIEELREGVREDRRDRGE